jgi:hypothetical protein
MPDWPENLRFCPVGDSYSEEPVDAVARTSFDAGPVKQRRRYTAAPQSLGFTLPFLTRAQYAEFQLFYSMTLQNGALPFLAKHPITGDQRSFRFRAPYSANIVSKNVVVKLQLEVLP